MSTPYQQAERESKAAAVPLFKLHMTKELWERTNSAESEGKIENPKKLTEEKDGMVTVELTGPQMTDYLIILNYNAHGGVSAKDAPLATAVYDASAAVIDQIESPPAPNAPAPVITVHAAVATTPSGEAP